MDINEMRGYKMTLEVYVLDGPDAYTDEDELRAGESMARDTAVVLTEAALNREWDGTVTVSALDSELLLGPNRR